MDYERFAVIGSNSFAGASLVAKLIADNKQVIGINRSPKDQIYSYPIKIFAPMEVIALYVLILIILCQKFLMH